ncbi:lens fiber membrane intrinsic protein-like [Hydra vulgaris]|uniref:Lens fiber membrane intrinsic protein-like n=1 Tax=Hydra vulgaris TaxID=6087 RepID=A0ABM4BYW8_HYDVU
MALINIIYCGTIFFGIVLAILSTSGNYWIEYTNSTVSYHSGIWNYCLNVCVKMQNKSASLIVTETFMVIGCLTYFLAFGLSLVSYFKIIKKLENHKISGAVLCATAVIMVIGLSTYTSNIQTSKNFKYSWSYIIGWCSVAISAISATICFLMKVESQPA